MNNEVKKLWIEALMSGDYQQATGKLRTEDGFCCLGVLCDLYTNDHEDAGWENSVHSNTIRFKTQTPYGGEVANDTSLPEVVVEWAGLITDDPNIKDISLSIYNDGSDGNCDPDANIRPHNFFEIAALIRGNL